MQGRVPHRATLVPSKMSTLVRSLHTVHGYIPTIFLPHSEFLRYSGLQILPYIYKFEVTCPPISAPAKSNVGTYIHTEFGLQQSLSQILTLTWIAPRDEFVFLFMHA